MAKQRKPKEKDESFIDINFDGWKIGADPNQYIVTSPAGKQTYHRELGGVLRFLTFQRLRKKAVTTLADLVHEHKRILEHFTKTLEAVL